MSTVNRMKIRRLVERRIINEIEEANRTVELALHKMKIAENRMKKRGDSKKMINEGLMDIASSFLNTDVLFDIAKKYLFDAFIDMIPGIDPGNPDDLMYSFFPNLFESIKFTEIEKLFGAESCEEVVSMLTETITEVVLEFGAAEILGYFVEKGAAPSSGVIGFLKDKVVKGLKAVGQESLNEVVVNIVKGIIEEPAQKYICDVNFTDIIGNFIGSDSSSAENILNMVDDGGDFFKDLGSIVGKASDAGFGKLLGLGGK